MTIQEILLLIIALIGVFYLGADLARMSRQQKRERVHLQKLGTGEIEKVDELPPRPNRITRRLRAAGFRLGLITFGSVAVLLGTLVFLIFSSLLPQFPLGALAASGVFLYLLWVLIQGWGHLRSTRFEEKLTDAVEFMVSALRAGENPTAALASAAETSEGVVAVEFREIVHRLDLGMSIQQAVNRMVINYDSEGVRLFTQTLVVKWQAGGNMAPVLSSVARIMRERLKMRMRLHSELIGARVSGVIMAILPYAIIPVILWRRPEWMQELLSNPIGHQLFVGAVLLQIIGFIWLQRLVRTDV